MSQKIFSTEKEIELINLVQQNPALYDYKLKSYKDIIIKNNLWKQIASSLKIPESDCRNRWKNIRDYYKKKRNEALKMMSTGSQRSENDFYYKFKHLLFLENTSIMDKETTSSVNNIDEIQDSENITESTNVEDLVPTENPDQLLDESLLPTTTDPLEETSKYVEKDNKDKKPKKKIRLCNENVVERLKRNNEDRRVLIREILQETQLLPKPELDPAISMFFQSIAATVNKFTPQLQARAKAEVINVITKLELLNISQQNVTTNYPNASFTQVSNAQFQSNYFDATSNNLLVNDVHSDTYSSLSRNTTINIPNFSCTDSANVQYSGSHSSENSNSIGSNFNSPESSQSPTNYDLEPDYIHQNTRS